MKLAASVVIYELKKQFPDLLSVCPETFTAFSLPCVWEPGMPFEEGCFYLCDGDKLPAEPPDISRVLLLFWRGEPPLAYQNTGSFLIWFRQRLDLYPVLNSIQAIFSKYIEWDETLIHLERIGAAPQQFLDVSARYFELFAFVIDSSFYFVADLLDNFKQLDKPPPPDFARIVLPETRLVLPETIQIYIDFFQSIYRERELVVFKEGPESHFFIGRNLFIGSTFIGMLAFMNWPRGLMPHDEVLLTYLAAYIERTMSTMTSGISQRIATLNNTIDEMMNGKHIEKAELNQQLNNTGFHRNDHYICATMCILPEMSKVYVQYILRVVSNQIPGALLSVQDDMIAILINETYSESKGCHAMEKLKSIVASLRSHAGISDRFSEIFSSRRFYHQAKHAYNIGSEAGGQETLYAFSDYYELFISKNCSGDLYPEMLWPVGFHRLIEHDKNSQVSYLDTLRVYLEENMNGLATARRLNIHRNSFTARLTRLTDLLGEDLDDPKARFRVALSFLLLDQMKEREYHRETFKLHIE